MVHSTPVHLLAFGPQHLDLADLQGALGEHPNPVALANTRGDQRSGGPVHVFAELAVGEGHVAVADRVEDAVVVGRAPDQLGQRRMIRVEPINPHRCEH